MKTFNLRYRNVDKLKVFLQTQGLYQHEHLLVQIFTSMGSQQHILNLVQSLKSLLPQANIIGCSTDGEIIDGKVIEKNTIISITQFDMSESSVLLLENDKNAFQLGEEIGTQLFKKDTKACILLATFKNLNAKDLVDGVNACKKDIVISGALAADYGKFKNAFVFDDQRLSSNAIVAVALHGDSLQASNHFVHDWEPISRKFRVNSVIKNRVFEVDNKPIKELYGQYMDAKEESSLPLYALQFPFVVKRNGQYISKLAIQDPKDGSLLFTSNINENEILQIAFADIDKINASTKILFTSLTKQPVETLFVFASSSRRRFLEYFAHKEIDMLQSFGETSGFFGFSEFYANEKQCNLFSQSLTVLALSESAQLPNISFKEKRKNIQSSLDYKTLKVLSNIAQVSSKELEILNKKLEERVNEGIRENRKKDSIMIHNSKLAQLGEMMGLIAHQWRQPLSAISATATGMQIKFELDTWTPEYVDSSLSHIEEYVLHLSDTINDFTDFFKPTKKRQKVQAREIIKKALFIMSPLLAKENILVVKRYASKNMLDTYPNEITQVILNLIKNSVNALLKRKIPEPEIYINEYHDNGLNYIEISDNAGGIDEAIIDKIFEPYFSTKNSQDSMGLGLYMSRFIIGESCGGSLDVKNIPGGVKFVIKLTE